MIFVALVCGAVPAAAHHPFAMFDPLRSDEPGGLFVSVTLPTGQTLGERAVLPAPAPAPATP